MAKVLTFTLRQRASVTAVVRDWDGNWQALSLMCRLQIRGRRELVWPATITPELREKIEAAYSPALPKEPIERRKTQARFGDLAPV